MIYDYDGVRLYVSYTYSHGYPDTREEPGEPPSVEIDSITIVGSDQDLYPIISPSIIQDIEEKCYEDARNYSEDF